ncbi:MAG: hypothetical protein KUG64_10755, partial [Cycloclasticus sp.]|nr:hypothetical protein [Cycloclasticus sp.]
SRRQRQMCIRDSLKTLTTQQLHNYHQQLEQTIKQNQRSGNAIYLQTPQQTQLIKQAQHIQQQIKQLLNK